MMKKKYLIAVFCLLAVLATASTGAAQKSKTVILVSDNEADSAVAETIKNVIEIDIATTPWGVFSEAVVDEINALEPSTVFILGGPMAVPSEYENSLSADYTVIRISGKDRYETAAAALNHFKENFKGRGIIIAYGYDSKGILRALEKAKKLGGIILFVTPDDIPLEVRNAIDDSEAEEVEIEESPDMDGEEIAKKLNKTKVKIKHEKIDKADREQRASEQIEEAREEIADAEEELGDCESGPAKKLLEQAKEHLEKAEKAFEEGEYGEAFGQAISAEQLAENAERFAKRHLCLGGTGPDGKDRDHDDDDKSKDDDKNDDDSSDDDETTTTSTSTSSTTSTTTTSTTTTTEETPTTTTTEEPTTTTSSTTSTTVEPTTTTSTTTTTNPE